MMYLQLAVSIIVSYSLGVVTGRFVKSPIGRWAFVVVLIAVAAGGFYLYGSFNTLQAIKQPGILGMLPKLW